MLPSFMEIVISVLEKKIYEGYLTYMAMAAIFEYQEMTLTFINYIFINDSISCPNLATFMYQAAKVSKISIVFAFSHAKAHVSKIDLAAK